MGTGCGAERSHCGELLTGAALALGMAGYLGLLAALGRFSHADETVYKAAGREWAATGRFAAPELTGWLPVRPPPEEVWFLQSPLYPFAFGLFARVAGFGWRQCVFFDAVIHCCLAVLTWRLARKFAPSLPLWAAPLVGLAVLPLGTPGKPDELALCFGLAGLLPLLGPAVGPRGVAVSGILFGLCAATHALAAVLLGMIALPYLGACRIGTIRGLFAWGVAAAAALALCLAPVFAAHPDAYRQYLAHARVLGDQAHHLSAFRLAWQYGKWYIVPTLLWLASVAGAWLLARPQAPGVGVRWWVAPACGVAFLAFFFPLKHLYYWFLGPWLLAAGAATAAALYHAKSRWAGALLFLLALGAAAGAVPWAGQTAVLLSLPGSQRLAANARIVHQLIPAGSTVMTDDYWWVVAGGCKVYDPEYAHPADPGEIDYIILVGNGSGKPGEPRRLPARWAAYVDAHFTQLHNNLNREPLTLLGRPLTRSAYGFGTMVLARSPGPGTAGRVTDRRAGALAHPE